MPSSAFAHFSGAPLNSAWSNWWESSWAAMTSNFLPKLGTPNVHISNIKYLFSFKITGTSSLLRLTQWMSSSLPCDSCHDGRCSGKQIYFCAPLHEVETSRNWVRHSSARKRWLSTSQSRSYRTHLLWYEPSLSWTLRRRHWCFRNRCPWTSQTVKAPPLHLIDTKNQILYRQN